MEYSQFIAQFSVLNEEELAYEALWKQGKLPPFPSFIALSGSGLADITLGDRLFFPTDDGRDCHVEKHTRFLPSYIHDHQFLEMEFVMKGSCVQEVYGGNSCWKRAMRSSSRRISTMPSPWMTRRAS
ncbi:MAG: hypothetical protein LKE39_05735 [Sphaerochaeta sp.]|nr:hypothetical protein [Sphaerochaeta sp.]